MASAEAAAPSRNRFGTGPDRLWAVSGRPFLQAALNGDRVHPAGPRSAAEIAADSAAAVAAGAQSVHVHAFDDTQEPAVERGQ